MGDIFIGINHDQGIGFFLHHRLKIARKILDSCLHVVHVNFIPLGDRQGDGLRQTGRWSGNFRQFDLKGALEQKGGGYHENNQQYQNNVGKGDHVNLGH